MRTSTSIPMVDLHAQHAQIADELDAAIVQVRGHGRFVNGPEIAVFEESFAAFCDVPHCVAVSSGTSALEVGMRAAGVERGDEVIVPGFTFFASVEAIVNVGATPVLVDVDPDTALTTVAMVEAAITDRTAAVIVVHLYGQPVDLPAFRELADRRGLLLIEDAAQAHGASVDGRRAGSVGDLATFSFFPGKNLGALGDAGAITTAGEAIAERARLLRNHGSSAKYRHETIGTNARIDTLQAALLSAKLPHLEAWNEARRAHARAYDDALAQVGGIAPIEIAPRRTSAYHLYTVRADKRDEHQSRLKQRGIASAVHYPMPVNRQPAMVELAGERELPNAQRLCEVVLSIPLYPEMTAGQRAEVIAALTEQ